jgi:high-affinity iron transporter
VVLFLWAIGTSGSSGEMLAGGLLGLVAGTSVGVLMYHGLLKIPMRHFFTVTGWLVLLIAAGLAAQAAGFLNQAGLLPALGQGLWDSSRLLDQSSIAGKMLHTLIGYTARPSGIQLLFYTVTLLSIFGLMRWVGRRHHPAAT